MIDEMVGDGLQITIHGHSMFTGLAKTVSPCLIRVIPLNHHRNINHDQVSFCYFFLRRACRYGGTESHAGDGVDNTAYLEQVFS